MLKSTISSIEEKLQSESFFLSQENHLEFNDKIKALLSEKTQALSPSLKKRVEEEFLGFGPLEELLADENISEILLQKDSPIGYEKEGRLSISNEVFYAQNSFERIFQLLLEKANMELSVEHPFGQGRWGSFRIHASIPPVCRKPSLTLRRLGHLQHCLSDFLENGTLNERQCHLLKKLIQERRNISFIGPTGCGKTSLLNACLQEIESQQRIIILEDTDELNSPNPMSLKLLTRTNSKTENQDIDLGDLVCQSLRMRPDRLVMGEIRGAEAKDLLMALSTGHAGSFFTLHADNEKQAMIRLEMLVQLGAPQWSLDAIRKLISLSLDYLVILERNPKRQIQGIHRLCGIESFGFLLEEVDLC